MPVRHCRRPECRRLRTMKIAPDTAPSSCCLGKPLSMSYRQTSQSSERRPTQSCNPHQSFQPTQIMLLSEPVSLSQAWLGRILQIHSRLHHCPIVPEAEGVQSYITLHRVMRDLLCLAESENVNTGIVFFLAMYLLPPLASL